MNPASFSLLHRYHSASGNVSATVCFIEDLEDLIVEVEGARTEFGPGASEGHISLDAFDFAVCCDDGIARAPAAELVADSVLADCDRTVVVPRINGVVAALVRRASPGFVGSG